MKKTFLITVLLSSLLLAGCGAKTSIEKSDSPTDSMVEKAETSQKDSIKKSEIKECLTGCEVFEEGGEGLLSREMCIDTCWAEEAEVKKDISICDEKVSAENALIQSGCRMNVAEATLDPKHCETIKDNIMKIGCYSELASLKKDPSICDNVEEGMMRTICVEGAGVDK